MKKLLILLMLAVPVFADEQTDCNVYTKTADGIDFEMSLTNRCPAGTFLATIACQVVGGDGDIESSITSGNNAKCMYRLQENIACPEDEECYVIGFGNPRLQINCCTR